MKKILIALDYDPTAQKVAEDGFSLANLMHAEVTLIHVVASPVYYSALNYSPIMGFSGYADVYSVEIADVIKMESMRFLQNVKNHLADEAIKTIVTEGDFATSIVETAKERQADIIVMGSHSKKWMEQILMGSVTENVLRHTAVPLLIIPTKNNLH
jgi:nucleotide-binding universal stress UspA family protein